MSNYPELPPIVKEGEKYTLKGRGPYGGDLEVEIKPKSDVTAGRWIDVETGQVFDNQLQKDIAIGEWRDGHRKLRLGWMNPDGEIEVP